jgi:hypothetical protein
MSDDNTPQGQLLIYNDGALNLQVRLDGQTVWLTQAQLAELYQTTPQNITLYLQNIYDECEPPLEATCKEFLQVRTEGSRQVRRALKHYSLDVILAVGYRVRSPRGTLFRQWATARLSELLRNGFTLDDERIKAGRIQAVKAEEKAKRRPAEVTHRRLLRSIAFPALAPPLISRNLV